VAWMGQVAELLVSLSSIPPVVSGTILAKGASGNRDIR
jgi:hypothetical protein